MAKFHLDRLKKKFGFTGGNYKDLITEVLTVNSGNISRAVGRLSKDHYTRSLRSIKSGAQRVILPDVSDAIPKRSVFLLKSAERGSLLTDKIRDKLTKDLRSTIEPGFIRRRGTKAGTVNPKAIADLEEKMRNTFSTYTKKDPRYGIPSNIHSIAVTEVRINADQMRDDYTKELVSQNEGTLKVLKHVIKNNSLVRVPRREHEKLARDTQRNPIPFNDNFVYTTPDGRVISTPHMHHSSMPADQVIGCSCETEYRTVLL